MASRLDCVVDWDKLAARAHFRVTELAKDCGVRALLATGKSVKEVAAEAGFNHQSNFARSFKHYYKATPSSQRRTL
jgi:AraC-like DNA-binding protein